MKVQQEQHEQNRGSGMVISNSREFDDRLMLINKIISLIDEL